MPVQKRRPRPVHSKRSSRLPKAYDHRSDPLDDVEDIVDNLIDDVDQPEADGSRRLNHVFELYLLSSMRARHLVQGALTKQLHLERPRLQAAQKALADKGLGRPGWRVNLIHELLGPPLSATDLDSPDPYRARVERFRLSLWNHLQFAVYTSRDGVVGEMRFERQKSLPLRPLTIGDLRPWQIVEDDVSADVTRITDEWFPMKDVVWQAGSPQQVGEPILLRFDFGLLQSTGKAPSA